MIILNIFNSIQSDIITAKIIISFHGVLLTRSDSSVSFNEQQKGQTEGNDFANIKKILVKPNLSKNHGI